MAALDLHDQPPVQRAASSPRLHTPRPSLQVLRTRRRGMSMTRNGVWATLTADHSRWPRSAQHPKQHKRFRTPSPRRQCALPTRPVSLSCSPNPWLRSDSTDEQSSTAQALRPLAPDAALQGPSGKACASPAAHHRRTQLDPGRRYVVGSSRRPIRQPRRRR